MPIVALLQKAAFDPETTHILTTAFDKAWDKFKSSGSPLADDACAPSTRALLAKQIIDIAQKGERNIDSLVENGVTYLQEVNEFGRRRCLKTWRTVRRSCWFEQTAATHPKAHLTSSQRYLPS